jgi:hypothetical protein
MATAGPKKDLATPLGARWDTQKTKGLSVRLGSLAGDVAMAPMSNTASLRTIIVAGP